MKKLALLTLVSLVSCGKVDLSNTQLLGQSKTYAPLTISSSTKNDLGLICNALTQKSAGLTQYVNMVFNFSLSQKSCEESSPSAAIDVPVTIQRPNVNYVFKRQVDGLDFVFPDVETNVAGIMAPICAQLDSLKSPYLANGNAVWITTSTAYSDCTPTGNERCVLFETGVPNGDAYKIVSREWIKFNTNILLPKVGFFTQRKSINSSLCAPEKNVMREVFLK